MILEIGRTCELNNTDVTGILNWDFLSFFLYSCFIRATNYPAAIGRVSSTASRQSRFSKTHSNPGRSVSSSREASIVPKSNPRARIKVRNKEQILVALKSAARKLGHAPTSNEFTRLSGITINQVRERFGGYRLAVRAAGLMPRQWGLREDTAALLEDWGKAVRQVGGAPSRREYSARWDLRVRSPRQPFSNLVAGSGGVFPVCGRWRTLGRLDRCAGKDPELYRYPNAAGALISQRRDWRPREKPRDLPMKPALPSWPQINDALASQPTGPPQPVATIASPIG